MNEGKLKASMWHIAENTCTLGHGDERLIVVGETLTVAGPIFMCQRGLHACERLLDALAYANGTVICEVILGADAYTEADKSVSTSRTCIAMTTPEVGERILRNFARWCALDVAHLWDMPENVRQYLETGDESVRAAAETAAWSAADAVSRSAAWTAADAVSRAASRSAAWTASRSAAWTAGDAAADVASWTAAKSASRSAARSAADAAADAASRSAADAAAEAASRSAAEAAAWTAADAASWIAAWTEAEAAVRERYSARLVEMVKETWRCSDER